MSKTRNPVHANFDSMEKEESQASKDGSEPNSNNRLKYIFGVIVLVLILASLVLILVFAVFDDNDENNSKKGDFIMWCSGNCETDITTNSVPGANCVGGGGVPDESIKWHIENAAGGDFVILTATEDTGYYMDLFNDAANELGMPLNSVRQIYFLDREASADETVLEAITNAEAIFFGGGDQSVYLDYWVDTDVQTIINSKLDNITVGGTSAGLAILGNWIFNSANDTIYSRAALQNPYDTRINIQPAFLHFPFMETILTDTHFFERDRMGRMNTFMARLLQDSPYVPLIRGMGVDEHTAVMLNITTGEAKTAGWGNVYLCLATRNLQRVCEQYVPLTIMNLSCTRINGTNLDTFSFATWSTTSSLVVTYNSTIIDGSVTNYRYGPYMGDIEPPPMEDDHA